MEPPADALLAAARAAVPGWVVRSVERAASRAGAAPDPALLDRAEEVGRQAADDVAARLRALLAQDVDEQRTTPLSILRDAVRYPTEVLRDAGIPPAERDQFAARNFPDDPYDLTPASFADVDPALVEPGIAWGAAKAYTHLRRHR